MPYAALSLRVVTACPVVLQSPGELPVQSIRTHQPRELPWFLSHRQAISASKQKLPGQTYHLGVFLASCVYGRGGLHPVLPAAPNRSLFTFSLCTESQHHRESGLSDVQHWLHSFPKGNAPDHLARVLQGWARTPGLLLLYPVFCLQILVGPSLVSPQT